MILRKPSHLPLQFTVFNCRIFGRRPATIPTGTCPEKSARCMTLRRSTEIWWSRRLRVRWARAHPSRTSPRKASASGSGSRCGKDTTLPCSAMTTTSVHACDICMIPAQLAIEIPQHLVNRTSWNTMAGTPSRWTAHGPSRTNAGLIRGDCPVSSRLDHERPGR
jgi:hypothetical protein